MAEIVIGLALLGEEDNEGEEDEEDDDDQDEDHDHPDGEDGGEIDPVKVVAAEPLLKLAKMDVVDCG